MLPQSDTRRQMRELTRAVGMARLSQSQPPAELLAFDQRVRRLIDEIGPSEFETWERQGWLPRRVIATFGQADIFRDRWDRGLGPGIAFGSLLLRRVAVRSGALSLALSLHNEVFLAALSDFGRTQHQRLLEDALAGTAVGCVAVTEETGGSDIAAVQTSIGRTTRGWHIQGEKRYISNLHSATHALVLARTAESASRHVIAIVPLDSEGVTRIGAFDKMGTKGVDAGHVQLDLDLPDEALLGAVGSGLGLMMRLLCYERLAVCSQLLGGTRYAVRLATAWLRTRRQFGSKLFDHQALRHRLAECAAELEAVDALFDSVASKLSGSEWRPYESAMLKLRVGAATGRIVDECLQFLGGRGYTTNYPLERLLRDHRLARIGAGTDEVMRELVAAAMDVPDPEIEAELRVLEKNDFSEPLVGLSRPPLSFPS